MARAAKAEVLEHRAKDGGYPRFSLASLPQLVQELAAVMKPHTGTSVNENKPASGTHVDPNSAEGKRLSQVRGRRHEVVRGTIQSLRQEASQKPHVAVDKDAVPGFLQNLNVRRAQALHQERDAQSATRVAGARQVYAAKREAHVEGTIAKWTGNWTKDEPADGASSTQVGDPPRRESSDGTGWQ